jgi:alkaline phosphatase D
MNRRDFLKIVAGAGLAAPSILGSSGCATVVSPTVSDTGLSLYCLSGDVTDKEALVWLRAEPDNLVMLQYGKDARLPEYEVTKLFSVDPAADHTVKILLDDLQPATRYYYRAAVSGKTPGPIGSFVTAPRSDDERKVTFCFSADTRESYKPFMVMNAVRAQHPDFFIHLGDTIYADRNGTARQLGEFWAKYRTNRDDLSSQYCFNETSVYVTWDDHEVEDNYLPGNPLAPIGRKAFLDYWPIRHPNDEPDRIYRSARWGRGVELFILDARQYRELKKSTMLGNAQKQWLFDGIAKSTALFKFIVTSVPMAGGGSDRWDGYPKERQEILRYINDKKLRGVYFLSGDMHYAGITKIPKSGGLKDITAGPLAAPLNRITNGTARRFEYFLAENFNFAKITVDPKSDPTTALLEFIDQDNRVFHTAKLSDG